MNRPATSKPRGICRYYNVPRGCFAGDNCKFLHAEPPKPGDPPLLTPYDKAKRCRYYAQGYCKRGDACWFLHVADPSPLPADEEDEEACSICFEKPSTYALLSGCSHIFCTTCIKQWRDPQNKPGGVLDSGNAKKCPMCRTPSKFITPSSRFWKDGTPEKAGIIQAYKESMARVPCRYFQKSIQKNRDKPLCPYGKDCFYQHLKEDGTPYVFKDGVDVCMRQYRQSQFQRRGLSFADMHFMPLSLSDLDFVLPVAGRSARENGFQNGRDTTMRRLQEMGRSLEILHDAISELPSFNNLEFTVETARAGLGHRTTRRRGRDEAARREDDFREFLSEQMMASLDRLRASATNHGEGQRALTPPPPLEAIATPARSPLRPHHHGRQRQRALFDDHGSDSGHDSMPGLESTSATEDDQWSDDEDPSDAEDADVELRAMELARMGLLELIASQDGAEETRGGDREGLAAEPGQESDGELPPLEPIDGSESESEDGPFVTDGRGRAVWTGPGEENKRDRSSERDGDGGGQAGGSGRSILGWFNALF